MRTNKTPLPPLICNTHLSVKILLYFLGDRGEDGGLRPNAYVSNPKLLYSSTGKNSGSEKGAGNR